MKIHNTALITDYEIAIIYINENYPDDPIYDEYVKNIMNTVYCQRFILHYRIKSLLLYWFVYPIWYKILSIMETIWKYTKSLKKYMKE